MLKERKSLCQLIEVTDKQLHEMNYSQAVIYSYRRCWRELIEYSITLKDITSYLKTTISWSQRTVASAICNLKQFLSFLYEEKYIKTDISLWIPTANHGRAATLPNIWTQDDIERLLSSVDRANPIGKRDYYSQIVEMKN